MNAPDIHHRARASLLEAAGAIRLKGSWRKEIIVQGALKGLLTPEEAEHLIKRHRLVHS